MPLPRSYPPLVPANARLTNVAVAVASYVQNLWAAA